MLDPNDLSDQEVVTKTIFGEASNQGLEGQEAVGAVIANRVKHGGWWGNTFKTVCLKPYQFSCWLESDPNRSRIMAAQPGEPVYDQCNRIAQLALSGQLIDPTNGATSYKVSGIFARWALGLTPIVTIGQHEFYKVN